MDAKKATLLIVAGIVLAACASELDRARRTKPMGDAFSRALSSGYLQLAENEQARWSQSNANRLARRAIVSAEGTPPAPDNGAWTQGRAARLTQLNAARNRLIDVLAANATKTAPEIAAKAQVAYDCWMMQTSSGNQADGAACRNQFDSAMKQIATSKPIKGESDAGTQIMRPVVVSPQPVTLPGTPTFRVKSIAQPEPAQAVALGAPKHKYMIYFEFDSAVITPEAEDVINDILAELLASEYQLMRIEGHADRAGSTPYNQALSVRRARAVNRALLDGASKSPESTFEGFGERRPAKATPDGVREVLNRRTEVILY